MCTHRLSELRANLPRRVQRCTCILKHHCNLLAAQPAPLPLRENCEVLRVEGDRTRVNLGGEATDLRNCLEQGGFAAAALANNAKHLARVKADADVLNHGIAAVPRSQMVNS